MSQIIVTYPMKLVHLNYLTTEDNDVNVLVIMDHFTLYAQAIITSSVTAKCTAQNPWDKLIVHYGLPEKIIINQGQHFESDLVK